MQQIKAVARCLFDRLCAARIDAEASCVSARRGLITGQGTVQSMHSNAESFSARVPASNQLDRLGKAGTSGFKRRFPGSEIRFLNSGCGRELPDRLACNCRIGAARRNYDLTLLINEIVAFTPDGTQTHTLGKPNLFIGFPALITSRICFALSL